MKYSVHVSVRKYVGYSGPGVKVSDERKNVEAGSRYEAAVAVYGSRIGEMQKNADRACCDAWFSYDFGTRVQRSVHVYER